MKQWRTISSLRNKLVEPFISGPRTSNSTYPIECPISGSYST